MKKIFSRGFSLTVLLFLSISLSGCLGSSAVSSGPKTGYHSYGIDDIALNIPDEWEVITAAQFASGVPAQTVIAFRSNIKNPIFTANVTISKTPVNETTQTLDYAKSLKHRIETSLVSYIDAGSEAVALVAGGAPADTLMIKSQGAERPQSDLKYFVHIPVIRSGFAYTIVGTTLANADDAEKEKIKIIAKSFSVK